MNSPPAATVFTDRVVEMAGAQGPLFGVLCEPAGEARAAVLIVAGQPQTRVGSHRMFTDLARMLASMGVTSLRFDVGGWGDSPGEALPFEASDRDIAAAAARLRGEVRALAPLWVLGLCDGASAAVLALPALRAAGATVDALVLINPWVRSEASLADAMVRTYYAKRLFQPEFWARLLTGKVSAANLLREPLRHLLARFGAKGPSVPPSELADAGASANAGVGATASTGADSAMHGSAIPGPDLPTQLLTQLERYDGEVLTVLSGDDLTAGETESLIARDRRWRKRLEQDGEILRVAGADHTFSQPAQWAQVARWIAERALVR